MNAVRIICGQRGSGKTTLARALVRRALEEGRWVFMHDTLRQYAGLCESYESVAAWQKVAGEAAAANRPMPRGASIATDQPFDLVDLADQIGRRFNSAGSARFPMTLGFDEAALLAQGTHIDQRLNRLMSLARHRQIELIMNCQRRAQLSMPFWDLTTDAYLFRQPTGTSADLEVPLCVDKGALAGLEQLEDHQYAHVVQGRGAVEEAL